MAFLLLSICSVVQEVYSEIETLANKEKSGRGGGGGEDEFPVCECASGVKSLAYLPPLFYFSFCDRWGMLAAI